MQNFSRHLMPNISIHSPHARGDFIYFRNKQDCLISIHSPHARGDTCGYLGRCLHTFQSTPLMRGETLHPRQGIEESDYFNPLPSCEGRQYFSDSSSHKIYFNPLPSCEGRPSRMLHIVLEFHFNPLPSCEGRPTVTQWATAYLTFQSTPLMRGETCHTRDRPQSQLISIHSPHARGDYRRIMDYIAHDISIHSPHARGDLQCSLVRR